MSDDLVSRQAAIDACYKDWNYDVNTIKNISQNIRELPSTKPPKETNGDCEIVLRWWKTSNGETIREWTIDEYVRWNPENQKLIPCTINNKVIDVKVHCVEIRRIYATHKGRKTMCFFDWIEYC